MMQSNSAYLDYNNMNYIKGKNRRLRDEHRFPGFRPMAAIMKGLGRSIKKGFQWYCNVSFKIL